MTFSLRTKFIFILFLLGLFMVAMSSVVFYFSFNKLLREEMQHGLINEAQEFAEHMAVRDGKLLVDELKEWEELEHLRDSEYARYIIIADTVFRTLRSSENLHRKEFQTYQRFEPSSLVQQYDIEMDSVRYFCITLPITRDNRIVGYVLAAENLQRIQHFADLFKETILVSFLILTSLGVIAAYVLANRVTKPLQEIQKAAGRIDLSSPWRRIELRDTEKEIANLSDSLNRLFDRLEKSFTQINEFSSNVSHELRTPLTILRGNIEVGLSRERTSEEYVVLLSELLEETIHVIRIVDDLLLLARADANALRIQKEPINLTDFCTEFSKDWEMICSIRNQHFVCNHESGIVIDADKNLLYQLILNLVSNASKYSAGNKTVKLSVKSLIPEHVHQPHVEISVSDQGIGIASADLEHVFDRFYRVDKDRSRETGGSGLGLSICRMITELHQGRISMESTVGSGTKVTVLLPSAAAGTNS